MGDLPAFYIDGPQNNRSVPLRVWGPGGGGTRPEWGTKAAMDSMLEMWAWMTGTLAGTIDTRSMSLEVTEYDWSKVNEVIYEDNSVVIRSIPAVHFEQSASFILEWNGLKLAFSGDTLPNKWWIEHAQRASTFRSMSASSCPTWPCRSGSFSGQEALERHDDDPRQPRVLWEGDGDDEAKARCGLPLSERLRYISGRHERLSSSIYDGPSGLRARPHGVERHEGRRANADGRDEPGVLIRRHRSTRKRSRLATIATKHPNGCVDGFPEEVNDHRQSKSTADFNKEHGTDYKFQLKE